MNLDLYSQRKVPGEKAGKEVYEALFRVGKEVSAKFYAKSGKVGTCIRGVQREGNALPDLVSIWAEASLSPEQAYT